MRYLMILVFTMFTIGCGSVTEEMLKDGGGGISSVGGVGGTSSVGGVGGTISVGGAGGTSAAGGVGGAAGKAEADASADTACVPDACNTCVNGVLTPVQDGTACGVRACAGTSVGWFACQKGLCTQSFLDCSKPFLCNNGQYAQCASGTGTCDPTTTQCTCGSTAETCPVTCTPTSCNTCVNGVPVSIPGCGIG